MVESDDSTGVPVASAGGAAGTVCFPVGADGNGAAAMAAFEAVAGLWPRLPDAAAEAAYDAARRALLDLEPASLGDAVALLTAAPLVGWDNPQPETVAMLARAIAYLTAAAPQLRRPALLHLAHDHAVIVHGA